MIVYLVWFVYEWEYWLVLGLLISFRGVNSCGLADANVDTVYVSLVNGK